MMKNSEFIGFNLRFRNIFSLHNSIFSKTNILGGIFNDKSKYRDEGICN